MTYLFTTSESDSMTITKDEQGNYYERRYGLPNFKITKEQVEIIAWLEANRRGQFTHLIYYIVGYISYCPNCKVWHIGCKLY